MTEIEWAVANQRYLMAQVARVRAALDRCALGDDALAEVTAALPAPSTLDTLVAIFGLSSFERDLVLLCAGVELDGAMPAACAAAHADPARPYPTFGLALAALPEAHWSALPPTAPLRRWRLIEVDPAAPLTTGRLRIDERILHYLAGVQDLDARLEGLVRPLEVPAEPPVSQQALADEVVRIWSSHAPPAPVIQLCGPSTEAKPAVAAAACLAAGLSPYLVPAEVLPSQPAEQESLRRLWEREVALTNAALVVDADAAEDADSARAGRFLDGVRGFTIVSARQPVRLTARASVRLDVAKPDAAEQRQLWETSLGLSGGSQRGVLDAVVAQFDLQPETIRAAAGLAAARLPAAAATVSAEALWDACRSQARPRMDELAHRIEGGLGWDDLVLPEQQLATLREIAAQVRQRALVHGAWGFAGQNRRGLGTAALFTGASGTGKTMAAEVLASELRLDLYQIDLSAVVSKYIGETEKNLRRVFDAAQDGGAVLFFDEADALFGKRSEVNDSHDRYANIEISYLLQLMESYRGLAILATNLRSALDQAFLRRLRFIVQFPFPDATQRAQIWRRVFPAATPLDGVDPQRLAQLNVTGGSIRNIALNAAFLAADAGEPVGMPQLLRAARGEYVKLERPLVAAEFGGWE